MGCDIHLHTEVKIDGVWHHYGVGNVNRNYEAFAKMAACGRRSDIAPLAPNRGIPRDATVLTKFDAAHWEGSSHSHSWLNAEEILAFHEWCEEQPWGRDKEHTWRDWEVMNVGYFFDNTWYGVAKWPGNDPEGVEDVRWIFWFDN